ncbi:hypothetical protein ACLOJK_022237 [Asimina triloba]
METHEIIHLRWMQNPSIQLIYCRRKFTKNKSPHSSTDYEEDDDKMVVDSWFFREESLIDQDRYEKQEREIRGDHWRSEVWKEGERLGGREARREGETKRDRETERQIKMERSLRDRDEKRKREIKGDRRRLEVREGGERSGGREARREGETERD